MAYPIQRPSGILRIELAKGYMVNTLFKKLDNRLDKEGVIIHKGKMADATIVETPRQRTTKEENDQVKAGEIPEEWKANPNKLRQKDVDAAWLKKNGETFMVIKTTSRPIPKANSLPIMK